MRDWKFNHIDFSTYPFYEGDDLGIYLTVDGVSGKVWAPTALEVEFRIYKKSAGGDPAETAMFRKAEKGTWELQLQGDFKGSYYTIRVNDGEWLNETPGVDARAVGINGKRGLLFDTKETNPEGWESDQPIELKNPVDAIIYELHVRDFSISPVSGMQHKGKFLAFNEQETFTNQGLHSGIAHLKELGITHVHLLPIADFYSVDEKHPEIRYNWGYDPLNYNTPEGSYASSPDDISRIREFKMLVQSLHRAGIGVIMDVVYNHTGYTRRSWFNQTVPGYYYRQDKNGEFSNASGCGNETASERAMVRKYIVDSLNYWASEYHLDGFRFDLMGIHDIETMNLIRAELDMIRPEMMIYGEGWTGGTSPMSENKRAVKRNVTQLDRIACFNDDTRDAVKGDNFDAWSRGFASGRTLNEEAVKFGIAAACHHPDIVYSYVESSPFPWANEPWQCVNYVSCHDNFTLFDKLKQSRPNASTEQLKKMQKLAGAIILTSQGIPFLHAGCEFCRTKQGEHNSYQSPDLINQLDWNLKSEYFDVFEYYQKLIRLRKAIPAFRMYSADQIRKHLAFSKDYQMGIIQYAIHDFPNDFGWKTIYVIFNGQKKDILVELEEEKLRLIARGNVIQPEGIETLNEKQVNVPAYSMMMLAAV